MLTAEIFGQLVRELGAVAQDDIAWAQGAKPPADAESFAREVIFVICNSGMRYTVARGIFERCIYALATGGPVSSVFGHKGKAAAIEKVWAEREQLLAQFLATPAEQRLEFLQTLPWIGGITKYHLAKNFGLDVAKPDVHLQRLADREGCTPQALCERLARETGLRVAAVDTVLWRACADGVIDSRTGQLRRGR